MLLGSFDPIHIAHINMASCALNSGLCDKVLFVVAKHNPWKENMPVDFDLRCEMVEASIKPFGDKCEVCTVENGIEPPVYAYKSLNALREWYSDDELYVIAGTDTIDAIPNWKCFDAEIKDKYSFIEVRRGCDTTEIDNEKRPFIVREGSRNGLTNKEFWYIKMKKLEASSTLVRSMVRKGMTPYPYVIKEVLDIINENNLYKQ